MLTIRMRRQGTKKRPFYRLVVIESHTSRDGRAIEVLGHYDPAPQPEMLELNRQRLTHWMSHGARPSDTVRTLLERHPPVEAVSGAETADGLAAASAGAESAEP